MDAPLEYLPISKKGNLCRKLRTFDKKDLVKQNEFIIFPSYLSHGVPPNNTNRTRKALGVNVLTKGTLGDEHTISEIIFGRYA